MLPMAASSWLIFMLTILREGSSVVTVVPEGIGRFYMGSPSSPLLSACLTFWAEDPAGNQAPAIKINQSRQRANVRLAFYTPASITRSLTKLAFHEPVKVYFMNLKDQGSAGSH